MFYIEKSEKVAERRRSVLEMNNTEAKVFFMKSESYFNAKLPDYIKFDAALKSAEKILKNKKGQPKDIESVAEHKTYKERDDLNYTIIMNKNGHYSWRPLVLIHPILYVDLVNYITNKDNWNELLKRFEEFQNESNIKCYSIPLEATNQSKKTDTSETILNWWEHFEQESIVKSIDYQYAMFTDITDCYPSIYTHSITWSLYGKEYVKKDKNKCKGSFGDKIDKKISGLQYNQTNGIPQGSVLMDFIAELVLGYADLELSTSLKQEGLVEDYEIIRYRDDYRIFSNSREQLEHITKSLSEILNELNFKLNSKKTFITENIVTDSVKPEKLYWEQIISSFRNVSVLDNKKGTVTYSISLQKHLWEIKKLSNKFPNCGILKKALTNFYKERVTRIGATTKTSDMLPLISILIDIMTNNPNCLSQSILTIGTLLDHIEDDGRALQIIEAILNKYKKKSNTEFLIVWLQRLALLFPGYPLKTLYIQDRPLTYKVEHQDGTKLFTDDWLNKSEQGKFVEDNLIDDEQIKKMRRGIKLSEINIFDDYSVG
ncbi:hypothetical protein TKO01_24000 [Tetragenococcus koreensis]|nr:hypothetical protein TKO01_24000 [Tetragenococcus koreensis]